MGPFLKGISLISPLFNFSLSDSVRRTKQNSSFWEQCSCKTRLYLATVFACMRMRVNSQPIREEITWQRQRRDCMLSVSEKSKLSKHTKVWRRKETRVVHSLRDFAKSNFNSHLPNHTTPPVSTLRHASLALSASLVSSVLLLLFTQVHTWFYNTHPKFTVHWIVLLPFIKPCENNKLGIR